VAVALDEAEAARRRSKGDADVDVFALQYHGHNVRFGTVSALMAGDARAAVALATPVVARLPGIEPGALWPQIDLAAAYFAFGRGASDAQANALPEPPATLPFARAMWHYAMGETAARRGDRAAIVAHAAAIGPADLKAFGDAAAEGDAMIAVARAVLDGRVAMIDGRWRDAAADYRRAADLQESTLSSQADPPVWWYPVRRSLAAALLAGGDPAGAEVEARRALARWSEDPIGLAILSGAAHGEGREAESRALMALARSRWSGDLATMTPALM
jgi:hypothetical protein